MAKISSGDISAAALRGACASQRGASTAQRAGDISAHCAAAGTAPPLMAYIEKRRRCAARGWRDISGISENEGRRNVEWRQNSSNQAA
jgi:hypothetical protein